MYKRQVEQIDMLLTNLPNKIYEKPISFLIKQNRKHMFAKKISMCYTSRRASFEAVFRKKGMEQGRNRKHMMQAVFPYWKDWNLSGRDRECILEASQEKD